MWLSRTLSLRQRAERESAAADMGVTTIGGGSASVMTRGEQRDLEVFCPGGIVWQPQAGDTVLVLKGGVGCQERCVVAADTAGDTPEGMVPGELFLFSSGEASIYLKADGSILVKGRVSLENSLEVDGSVKLSGDIRMEGDIQINGTLIINGMPYRPCMCGME